MTDEQLIEFVKAPQGRSVIERIELSLDRLVNKEPSRLEIAAMIIANRKIDFYIGNTQTLESIESHVQSALLIAERLIAADKKG